MEEKLSILEHLFGEADEPKELTAMIEADDGLRREYQAMSEVKFYLDGRAPKRPDALVLDAVVAAAASSGAGMTPRQDRPARPSGRGRRMRLAGVSGVLGVLLVILAVGLGYFRRGSQPVSAPAASRDVPIVAKAAPPAAVPPASEVVDDPAVMVSEIASVAKEAVEPSPAEARRVDRHRPTPVALQWDESAEVRELHRRIGFVEARSTSTDWGEPILTSGNTGIANGFQQVTDWDY
ncbi:MAG TPA: hypothetical protein VFG50_01255 [Rhodothermales bacterium]|nr:hypothetical protein [Rhodothermales bacterium]